MQNVRYSFTRGHDVAGFLSTNRASTDALKALQRWIGGKSRSYEVQQDEDDQLVADLKFDKKDVRAGTDLEDECKKYGIERIFVNDV